MARLAFEVVCRTAMSLGAAWLIGCQGDDLPPLQVEGDILSYAADEPVCEQTVEYGERWMVAVADRLGITPEELLHTTYYRLDTQSVTNRCGQGASGCMRAEGDELRIYDDSLLAKHELVHAIHRSAWPRRRPLLTEGLAQLFDDEQPQPFPGLDVPGLDLDLDAQIEADDAEPATYVAGSWIVHWIVQRHGIDAFREFWHADDPETDADEFRALFEQHFGESLDVMLAAVEGQPACPLLTCVEELVPWQADVWTTSSPTSCDDGLTIGDHGSGKLERSVLIEVPAAGSYAVTVSSSELNQGAFIHPCAGPCPSAADNGNYFAGTTRDLVLEPGLHRVTTFKLDASDPGVSVEIRPN